MIRVGSNLKPLVEYPEKEQELWRRFDTTIYELRIAKFNVTEDEAIQLLDFSRYYDSMQLPIPRDRGNIMSDFCREKFLKKNDAGNYDITNLGALMISKNIKEFEYLFKRAVRVIRYKDTNRLEGISEREFVTGYAFSHEEIVQYIMAVIPQEEVIEGTIRKSLYAFPEIAIRELLANIMIHQSLEQRGTSPMVEIFSNRIEFSNAGAPLIAIDRFVDSVPVSRNENIAGFMHKCGICEERGSGYDKIVQATFDNGLMAPKIVNQNSQFTKATLFAKLPFERTSKEDRIRTCYMLACLAYMNSSAVANVDIRHVFDLPPEEGYKASRIIKDTIQANLIKHLKVEL